jgi:hypothetical protein
MSHTKRTRLQKISLSLAAVASCLAIALSVTPVVSAAPPPAPSPTAQNAQSAQCQGDKTACVCPTTKSGNTPATECTDPAFENCTINANKRTYNCSGMQFENCNKKYSNHSSKEYKDCLAANNLFTKYLNPFVYFLGFAAGLGVVIGILIGGIQYMASAGDPQKAAAAKRHIWNAILAMLVYLFMFAIINFLVPGGIL